LKIWRNNLQITLNLKGGVPLRITKNKTEKEVEISEGEIKLILELINKHPIVTTFLVAIILIAIIIIVAIVR
jgi:hypothetical protein